jgi:hypothetical protein
MLLQLLGKRPFLSGDYYLCEIIKLRILHNYKN